MMNRLLATAALGLCLGTTLAKADEACPKGQHLVFMPVCACAWDDSSASHKSGYFAGASKWCSDPKNHKELMRGIDAAGAQELKRTR